MIKNWNTDESLRFGTEFMARILMCFLSLVEGGRSGPNFMVEGGIILNGNGICPLFASQI